MTLQLLADHAAVLRVLFVAPADTRAQLEALASQRGWLGRGALWTEEALVQTTARYPAQVLLSPEGRVVLAGGAGDLREELLHALEGLA